MTDLLIDALASYRLWRLAADDLITKPARDRLYDRLGRGSYLQVLLDCPWCLGFWIVLAAALLRWRLPRLWAVVRRPLAASAIVGGYAEILVLVDEARVRATR